MHCRRFQLAPFALVCLLAAWTPAANAQDELDDSQSNEAIRAKLYEALSREVATLDRQSNVLKAVVKLVRPTVVHIEAEKTDAASLQYRGKSAHIEEAGSGYVVRLGGRHYVLTNGHVVKAAKERNIKIRFADGRQTTPTKVWSDSETDIAVMAVDMPNLVASKLGNSDELEMGDFVLAVGSPFGLSHSITFGIVSATGRWDLKLGEGVKYQHFIQTDAAINPGNSGGPLINLRGEVVGMNTAIASSSGGNEGVGFSIPINLTVSIARQLVENNAVARAFLGVKLDSRFDTASAIKVGLQRVRGARINEVTPNSPAAAAPLLPNDVILEYAGVRVENDSHLINLVNLTEVGRDIPLVVYRDHKPLRMTVKVGPAPGRSLTTK